MTALNEAVDLVEVQPGSDFEDIQLWEDKELLIDVLEDLINIDGFENNVENNGLSNKPLDKGFYPIFSRYNCNIRNGRNAVGCNGRKNCNAGNKVRPDKSIKKCRKHFKPQSLIL